MEKIQKAKETMSAKERVWKTFQHEKTDRVAIVMMLRKTFIDAWQEHWELRTETMNWCIKLLV